MRAERKGSWRPLLNALVDLSGGTAELVSHSERAWASITFAGTRHRVTLAFAGQAAIAAGEALIAALPEHEFTVPGQVVIDATVIAVEHALLPAPKLTVEAELLLLEED